MSGGSTTIGVAFTRPQRGSRAGFSASRSFRYRLVGTGHRDVRGADFTGRWLDEALPSLPRLKGFADFVAVASGEIRYCRRTPDFPIEKG